MSKKVNASKRDGRVLRHGAPKKELSLARGNEKAIEAIGDHIERHLGTSPLVWHEIVSHLVHIDLHVVPPSKKRPFFTLVTSGMSDKPMPVPKGAEELRFAELVICLPPSWPMNEKEWKKERHFWPIQFLKFLARMPHEFDTWLGVGHTIPNDDPPKCFPGTKFCCAFIGPACNAPDAFEELKINSKKTINFYGVHFLFREEMELKMEQGVEVLWERLAKAGVTELVDLKRRNVAK